MTTGITNTDSISDEEPFFSSHSCFSNLRTAQWSILENKRDGRPCHVRTRTRESGNWCNKERTVKRGKRRVFPSNLFLLQCVSACFKRSCTREARGGQKKMKNPSDHPKGSREKIAASTRNREPSNSTPVSLRKDPSVRTGNWCHALHQRQRLSPPFLLPFAIPFIYTQAVCVFDPLDPGFREKRRGREHCFPFDVKKSSQKTALEDGSLVT